MSYTKGRKVYAEGDSDVVKEWGLCRCKYELYEGKEGVYWRSVGMSERDGSVSV